jgi:hypothetical protein
VRTEIELNHAAEAALRTEFQPTRRHTEATVGLFTIEFEFEFGDKTRDTLRRLAKESVIRFELGPETRALIERLATPRDDDSSGVGGLVKKGAAALRS